jgi:cob(I)alamin adenosyltransferase
MKIYTKSGDNGSTALVSGRRVQKSELLLEAYGTVDELNSFIGLLLNKITADEEIEDLNFIQNVLFNVGSILAQDGADYPNYPTIEPRYIDRVEQMIDRCAANLPALTQFILPGGNEVIALCHVCRTICRRAERRVVSLEDNNENVLLIIQLLNRLSDYFFTLARFMTIHFGIKEVTWNSKI